MFEDPSRRYEWQFIGHHVTDNSVKLDWEARLNIAIGVAQGK